MMIEDTFAYHFPFGFVKFTTGNESNQPGPETKLSTISSATFIRNPKEFHFLSLDSVAMWFIYDQVPLVVCQRNSWPPTTINLLGQVTDTSCDNNNSNNNNKASAPFPLVVELNAFYILFPF